MATNATWLEEGLQLLAELGAGALRIDRLAGRLGLSKGSFYHHFAGMTGYRIDLLAHYEKRYTARYIEAVARSPETTPRDHRRLLTRLVLDDDGNDQGLHVAVRAWAMQDDDVRATVERIDRTRLAYLTGLFAAEFGPGPEAVLRSQQMYLLLIGARHVLPPLGRAEIRRLYDFVVDNVMDDMEART